MSKGNSADSKAMIWEFTIYTAALLFTFVWFLISDAYVNEEPLHTFYQPLLRALNILRVMGSDGFEQIIATHHGYYPYGIYFMPFLLHYTGLNSLVTAHPEIVVLLQLLLWCAICHNFFPRPEQSVLFFLLCFSFPLFTVSLKSFSPHSWNVVTGILFVFFFERYEKKACLRDLFYSFCAGVLCVSIKHFGLVIISLFFLCKLWERLCFKLRISHFPLFVLCVMSAGLLFYPHEQLWWYVNVMFSHHAHFSVFDGFLLLGLFVALLAASVFMVRHARTRIFCSLSPAKVEFSGFRLAGRELFVLFHILLVVFYFLYAFPFFVASAGIFYVFLLLLTVFGILCLIFCRQDSCFLYALFYAGLGAACFFYLFAHHIDFFVFPFVLLFFLAVREGLDFRFKVFLIIGGFLIGNLFPSLHQIEVGWGETVRDAFIRIFSSTSWYPWSWRHNSMKRVATEMQDVLRPYIRNEELVALGYRMSFKTQQELNWPPYFLIDQLPGGEVDDIFAQISDLGVEAVFRGWLAEKRVPPVIVEALREWTGQYVFEENMGLSRLWSGFLLDENPASRAVFSQMVGESWMEFLQKENLFNEVYRTFVIPVENPLLKLHIYRGLKPDFSYQYEEPVLNRGWQKTTLP